MQKEEINMNIWESFCGDTSLHGYQYVGRSDRSRHHEMYRKGFCSTSYLSMVITRCGFIVGLTVMKVMMDIEWLVRGESFWTLQKGLNGWISPINSRREKRPIWCGIVILSILGALILVAYNVNQFLNSYTVVTLESSTEDLENIFFPSITICNRNQIRLGQI